MHWEYWAALEGFQEQNQISYLLTTHILRNALVCFTLDIGGLMSRASNCHQTGRGDKEAGHFLFSLGRNVRRIVVIEMSSSIQKVVSRNVLLFEAADRKSVV